MQKVTLGNSDLQISRIGFGCMGMSEFYGDTGTEAKNIALIHKAIELGVNFLDTADIYGPFHNERLVGKAIKDRREELVIATKFGIMRSEEGGFLGINGRPEYVRKACEDSLKRLDIEVIDLYYQHRKDPQVAIEETVGAMADLVKEGKVRYLGLSEIGTTNLRKAHLVHPISAVQSEYSIWSTDIEAEVIPACDDLGITLVAYSPLGRGFLTGQIKKVEDLAADDYRRYSPRFLGENFQKNLDLVAEVEAIAANKGVKTAQIAIAWVLSKGENIVPIPGTKKEKYLIDNVNSVNVVLSESELEKLNQLSREVKGGRYDDRGMGLINAS
ncbi:MAG: aldo/keto reductase [Chitinophagales bacterium]